MMAMNASDPGFAPTRPLIQSFGASLDYMSLHSLQHNLSFFQANGQCTRSSDTYDIIQCPAGYFKASRDEVAAGCSRAGLSCPQNVSYEKPPGIPATPVSYICICSPCIMVPKLDHVIYPTLSAAQLALLGPVLSSQNQTQPALSDPLTYRCKRMDVCFEAELGVDRVVQFLYVDNLAPYRSLLGLSPVASVTFRPVGGSRSIDTSRALLQAQNFGNGTFAFAVQPQGVGTLLLQVGQVRHVDSTI